MTALIQFTSITKRGSQPCWLESASFADGPGMKVKNMKTTFDIAKAARFSLEAAHDIAVQFSQLRASLVRPDGSMLRAESEAVVVEQRKRFDEINAVNDKLNREVKKSSLGMI